MALLVAYLVLFLAMAGHSRATYCICKDGVGDQVLQKNIDYACGAGADCTPIHENGPCYNPNTVKDHCNYAVNSYFQRKGQAPGSCDFAGTAAPSPTIPTAASGCAYPSSPSNAGTTTPSTNPTTSPIGGAGGTGGTGGTGTNPINTPTGGAGFNSLGPSGSGLNPDGSGTGAAFAVCQDSYLLVTVLILGLIWLRY
ncbi:hypothetical protein M9H77_09843 [Catharanthus roseus]|uniref:Uncharacterized protein n=1 Tax=Catharanthus roseus TaxID=4058 RepID=A0ACC0C1N9_CATRO|nr:hypothetical protein M9H77_09843 [Catharanthus roseus]